MFFNALYPLCSVICSLVKHYWIPNAYEIVLYYINVPLQLDIAVTALTLVSTAPLKAFGESLTPLTSPYLPHEVDLPPALLIRPQHPPPETQGNGAFCVQKNAKVRTLRTRHINYVNIKCNAYSIPTQPSIQYICNASCECPLQNAFPFIPASKLAWQQFICAPVRTNFPDQRPRTLSGWRFLHVYLFY